MKNERILLYVLVLIAFISNDLTQMVNFPTRIPWCDFHSPALLDLFLSSDASICWPGLLTLFKTFVPHPSFLFHSLFFHSISDSSPVVTQTRLPPVLIDTFTFLTHTQKLYLAISSSQPKSFKIPMKNSKQVMFLLSYSLY